MGFFNRRKNKIEDEDDIDLDNFDFDEDLDFGEPGGDRKPSKLGIAKDVAKATGKATASKVGKDAMAELIPGDFESNFTELKDLATESKDAIKDGYEEIKKSFKTLLPKAFRGDGGDSIKRPNEKELQDAAIRNAIEEMFSKGASENSADKAVGKNGEIKGEGVQAGLQGLQNKIFTQMSNDISKLTGFMVGVGSQYFRKSLEIQHRSYYLQLDMLKSNTIFYRAVNDQLDKITKNTALPEHVKITNSERFEGFMKDNLIQNMYASAFSNSDLINRFKNNFRSSIKNRVADIKDMFEMVVNFRDSTEDNKSVRTGMATSFLGGYLGDKLGTRISNKIMPRLKDRYGNDPRLKWLGNTAQNMVHNTGSAIANARVGIKDRLEEAEGKMGAAGWLQRLVYGNTDKLFSMFDKPGRDRKLKKDTIESLSSGAIFDKLTHRSINEVIPMYLSKILHENKELRSMYHVMNSDKLKKRGYSPSEELRYNIFTRKLDTQENIRLSADKSVKTLFNKNDEYERFANNITEDAARILKTDGLLSKKESELLSKRETKNMVSDYIKFAKQQGDVRMDFKTLFVDANDPDKANKALSEYIARNPRLERAVKYMSKLKDSQSDQGKNFGSNFESRMENVASDYPTRAVRDFFIEIADIGKSPRIKLDVEQSEIIAKAFTDYYILAKNANLSIDFRSFENAFSYIPPSKQDVISEPVILFSRYFRQLVGTNDYEVMSRVQLAIGNLATQIAYKTDIGSGKDRVMEVFQKLNDIDSSIMGGIDEIGSEQIVEKSALTGAKREAWDIQSLYKLTRPDGETVRAIQNKIFDFKFDGTFARMDNIVKGLKDIREKNGGNTMRGLWEQAKFIAGEAKEVSLNRYKDIGDLTTKMADQAQKLTVSTAKSVIGNISGLSGSLNNKLSELREEKTKLYEEELQYRMKLRDLAKERTQEEVESIDRDIEKFKERHIKYMELLKRVEEKGGELFNSINSKIDDFDPNAVDSTITSFRQTLSTKVTELNELLKISKQLGA